MKKRIIAFANTRPQMKPHRWLRFFFVALDERGEVRGKKGEWAWEETEEKVGRGEVFFFFIFRQNTSTCP